MKKLLAMTPALAMSLSLVACGGGDKGGSGSNGGGSSAGGGSNGGGSNAGSGEPIKITLITMDQMDVHWVK